jgi:hypothetical protein
MAVGEPERRAAPTRLLAGRDASSRRVEFGSVPGLILEHLGSPRRRPCRSRLGNLRRQAEVSQDPLHHSRMLNQSHEAQPPAAARTRQDIELKCSPHQLGPLIRTWPGRLDAARVLVSLHRRFPTRDIDTLRRPGDSAARHAARGARTP